MFVHVDALRAGCHLQGRRGLQGEPNPLAVCWLRSLPVLEGRVLVAGCASTRRGLLGTPSSGTPGASPAWKPGPFPPLLQKEAGVVVRAGL